MEKDYKKMYEDALNRAMNLALTNNISALAAGEIFPELNEAEDERIRTAQLDYWRSVGGNEWYGVPVQETIAWLEKQGEKSNIHQDAEDYLRCQHTIRVLEYARSLDAYNQYGKESINKDIAWLEKQGEQNPADKIEPKFHQDDWITNGACIIKITSIDDRYYWHDNDCAGGDIKSIDKEYHLWTIQDAKDGDVLYCKIDDDTEIIVMCSGINIHNNVDSYCRYNSKLGFNTYITNVLDAEHDFITPATKEQRDILFQKIKEAGYEWDAEKKELKKIDQKPACKEDDESWFKELELMALSFSNDDSYRKQFFEWLKSLKDRVKQKQKWSEDDSRILNNVKAYIVYAAGQRGVKDELFKEANEWLNYLPIGFIYNKNYNEDMVTLVIDELKQIANNNNAPEQYKVEIDWLKSLRPQPKQEWSKDDEKIKSLIISTLTSMGTLNLERYHHMNLDEVKNWLKSLKDRVQPQPKQEWSEEDEEFISILIERINQLYVVSEKLCKYEDRDRLNPKHKDWLIEKIKSLKPNHWKPSEKEMIDLYYAAKQLSVTRPSLKTLYEHLNTI